MSNSLEEKILDMAKEKASIDDQEKRMNNISYSWFPVVFPACRDKAPQENVEQNKATTENSVYLGTPYNCFATRPVRITAHERAPHQKLYCIGRHSNYNAAAMRTTSDTDESGTIAARKKETRKENY